MLGNATHTHVCMDSRRVLRNKVQMEVADSKYYFQTLELKLMQAASPGVADAAEFKGPYAEPAVRSPSETEAPPQSPPAPYLPECCTGGRTRTALACQAPVEAEQTETFDHSSTRTPSQ